MKHDLLHIQGKPYVLIPLHEYRLMTAHPNLEDDNEQLPDDILDQIVGGESSAIKILRNFRGHTQQELADAAGLSRPYLTEIERGNKNGSIRALKALAAALDVNVGLLAA